jgi:methionine biosynthesis protein MetW
MKSPITNSNNTKKIGVIPGEFLRKNYKEKLNIDIDRLIPEKENISIHKCKASGLIFFSGNFYFGDSKFYEDLEKIEWYYSDWKWEYEKVFEIITFNDRVLDVGCGFGYFLEKIKNEKRCEVEGIEFNQSAIKIIKDKGIKVHDKFIEDLANTDIEPFDVVCSFQVLEHVENPLTFLKAKIDCLKKDGKLIIAVPNNDSFIKHSKENILNMPPHHSLLWNKKSLKYLTQIFPLEIIDIYYEGINKNHPWYNQVIEDLISQNHINNFISGIIPIYKKLIIKILKTKLNRGHSMMVVFKKL